MSTIDSITVQATTKSTEETIRRYRRIAGIYDFIYSRLEKGLQPGRSQLWQNVVGPRVLDVGVGTGRNMEFYRDDLQITAIDLVPEMLRRASKQAQNLGKQVDLRIMDVQNLEFPNACFDSVVSTCVFCSVPDPVLGLREVRRVTKIGGRVVLLEHVRPKNERIAAILDLINPVMVRIIGSNMNRRTVENVQEAGLSVERVINVDQSGIFKLIFACRNESI